MIIVLITLIAVAIALIIVSFFANDQFSELESQIEQFSISTMQDTYQLKKKIKILEEELLTEDISDSSMPTSHTQENKPLMIQKVYHLHQQGYSVEEISGQTALHKNDVQTILNNSK